jgi:hypothetical protein
MFTDRTKLQYFGNNLANMCERSLTAWTSGTEQLRADLGEALSPPG